MPEVLVAGAGGWLGRSILAALAGDVEGADELPSPRKPSVRGLLAPGEERPPEPAEWVEGDVRRPESLVGFFDGARGATLLCTVGVIHPRRVRDFYDVNVDGVTALLRAAAAAGVRRAVVVSSNSPFGCNPFPEHRFDEDSPYAPYRHYGRSKMLMERAAFEEGRRGSMEVSLVRAPWFYGPRQPPRQTLFFTMVRDGKMPLVGGGANRRSMAYVDNLSQGILRAGWTPAAAGKAYWIADERPYPMTEIVDTVERLLETEFGQTCAHRRLRLPGLASTVAGWIDAASQGLGMYLQKIHVLSEMNQTIACSVERARRELGYRPLVALEEGMRRSLRWIADRGLL